MKKIVIGFMLILLLSGCSGKYKGPTNTDVVDDMDYYAEILLEYYRGQVLIPYSFDTGTTKDEYLSSYMEIEDYKGGYVRELSYIISDMSSIKDFLTLCDEFEVDKECGYNNQKIILSYDEDKLILDWYKIIEGKKVNKRISVEEIDGEVIIDQIIKAYNMDSEIDYSHYRKFSTNGDSISIRPGSTNMYFSYVEGNLSIDYMDHFLETLSIIYVDEDRDMIYSFAYNESLGFDYYTITFLEDGADVLTIGKKEIVWNLGFVDGWETISFGSSDPNGTLKLEGSSISVDKHEVYPPGSFYWYPNLVLSADVLTDENLSVSEVFLADIPLSFDKFTLEEIEAEVEYLESNYENILRDNGVFNNSGEVEDLAALFIGDLEANEYILSLSE